MKIRSLTLHGFKSFADKTKIELHEGITAIVGPNGCGKSNISDALRWVLGEQRPTAIRGARMEEAIFEGTSQRQPIHRAEVTLEIANEDGILAVPYSEVAIGRTVYRGGDGQYTLNGSPCRLRDILDLCRDTGLGANAYSIIESRMIDAILSDRTEERRALFEEAAEIGRYKDRRRTALRRLEQAEGDLARLDDVISEVQTKVRSLARQRGRAERYLEYRERRLQLEIAVERSRLNAIAERLATCTREVAELQQSHPAEAATLATHEEQAEQLRTEIQAREAAHAGLAGQLEDARSRVDELERQRLIADERASAAESRIAAIDEELASISARGEELEAELAELATSADRHRSAARELRNQLDEAETKVERLRLGREERKLEEEAALGRLTELIRRASAIEAERESASARFEEREAELGRRQAAREQLRAEAARLEQELEKATSEAAEAANSLSACESELEAAQAEMSACRDRLRAVREEIATLEGTLSADRSRAGALAALLASGQDLPSLVSEILEQRASLPGIHGILADYMQVAKESAPAVEAHLGAYLHGLVVRNWDAVRAIRDWMAEVEESDGLLLLPADPGPRVPGTPVTTSPDALLERVAVAGEGAEWARALLVGVATRSDGRTEPAEGAWVAADGSGQDHWGAVRIGQPGAGRGVLSRRAELVEVRERIETSEVELDRLQRELEREGAELQSCLETVDRIESDVTRASRHNRECQARREAAEGRRARARGELEEVTARIAELTSLLEEARTAAAELERQQSAVEEEREGTESALARARASTQESTESWESERAELHEVRLLLAQKEASAGAAEDRLDRARSALAELAERRHRLEVERAGHRGVIESGRQTVDASAGDLGDLVEGRTRLQAELNSSRDVLDERKQEMERVVSWLREARAAERERADRRHALELEITELRGRETGIRERLEAEWDATLDSLLERATPPAEGMLDEWSIELEGLRAKLANLGPVNLLAAEEYQEEKHRLDFLNSQRSDLVAAGQDLHASIRRINESASAAFHATFDQVRHNFRDIFVTLFEGGECDLWLTDPDDPLDSPIEVSASPRGKRTQRLHLLSGGERALTALALLFGIYLTKPSPFCVMDEVDAPLDEQNIHRFTTMLQRFKAGTQFIIVTHNPRTIEAADWIYGVTMQEPGVSSVVGVEFAELPAGQVA